MIYLLILLCVLDFMRSNQSTKDKIRQLDTEERIGIHKMRMEWVEFQRKTILEELDKPLLLSRLIEKE